MSPRLFTALLESAIPLGGGIWASLVGFGYIGIPPAAELNTKYQRRRQTLRVAGPMMILLGIVIGMQPFFAPGAGLQWQTYAPENGHFSADMPGTPAETVVEETGEFGPVENHVAQVFLRRLDVVCTVRRTPFPEDLPDHPRDRLDELLREQIAALVALNKGTLIFNREQLRPDGVEREFRIEVQNHYIFRGRLLFLGRTEFQMQVIAPAALADSTIANRFLESFEYHDESEK